jgi:hypothetical protein
MNAYKFPFALIAFFGLVGVVPVWVHYLDVFGPQLTTESQFLAALSLPAVVLLFLASWLQPRGS